MIRRIRPVHSREVMQRNARAPAVGRGPDYQRQQETKNRQAQYRRTRYAEIDQEDHDADRQSAADHVVHPRVTGIRFENKAAVRTNFKLGPPGEQRSPATVWTAFAQSSPKRYRNSCFTGRVQLLLVAAFDRGPAPRG